MFTGKNGNQSTAVKYDDLAAEQTDWQLLTEHLYEVAEKAKSFARYFSGEQHAWLAGLLHDLGKAEEHFQERLKDTDTKKKKRPHAHHGAALALCQYPDKPVWPVAFAINGHHAGLHNRDKIWELVRREGSDYFKAAKDAESKLNFSDGHREGAIEWPIPKEQFKNLPDWFEKLSSDTGMSAEAWLAVEFYTRFLFSALVDADRLNTEAYVCEKNAIDAAQIRNQWSYFDTEALLKQLDSYLENQRRQSQASGTVQQIRSEVAGLCDQAALQERGIFSLTVPTGGGKTLSSLRFALRHCQYHNRLEKKDHEKFRRIIIVIPYLSIIEQTAETLKEVFREETPLILEHHSQTNDPVIKETKAGKGTEDDSDPKHSLRQLAAENWDAPIIVTTSVQFFDSIFSRRPTDARKLHNIACSVIIFDEVQTLPPKLMQPILSALGELTNPQRPYGCSVVLCTATQPALGKNEEDFPYGLKNVREINDQKAKHFPKLRRTHYHWPQENGIKTWQQLGSELLAQNRHQGLIIVNTRPQAQKLFKEVKEQAGEYLKEAIFHLSTWMYPAHRLHVLTEVRRRLRDARPCFLISTQCIEAGVDVDFPEIWRAFGPYDSIVQAAGRCNREGKLDKGNVHIFHPEEKEKTLPDGVYRTATDQTSLLQKIGKAQPDDPESFGTYFRLLYQITVPDDCPIQKERSQLHFEEVSKRFNLIENQSVSLLIEDPDILHIRKHPYREPCSSFKEWCEEKKRAGYFTREEWRQLQPYMVKLDYRNSKTVPLLSQRAAPIFKDDTTTHGLWRLMDSCLYKGGLNGSGLDGCSTKLTRNPDQTIVL